jgi:hypothetical protein
MSVQAVNSNTPIRGRFMRGQTANRNGRPDGRRYRAVADGLTRQLVERDGKPPTAAQLCMVDQISFLASKRRADGVRTARAIADLLAALGLAERVQLWSRPLPKPEPPRKTLKDHLAELARHDATEAAGASDGEAPS